MDEGEFEVRTSEELNQDEPVGNKLDRVLEKLEKIDVWKDETDRRLEGLDPNLSRETEPPLGFDDGDEADYEDYRRGRHPEWGGRYRNPNPNIRDGGRGGFGWDQPNNRNAHQQFGG